jgi:hypothetical protein
MTGATELTGTGTATEMPFEVAGDPLPAAFDAVTAQVVVVPPSAVTSVYVLPVADAISTPSRFHRYV